MFSPMYSPNRERSLRINLNKFRITLFIAVFIVAFFFVSYTAQAMDELDLSVGFKTLPLLDNKLSGVVPVAIIYDPKIPESQTEANSIDKILSGGFKAPGDIKLSSVMVPADNLSALSSAKIGLFTKGSCTTDVARAAKTQRILTMSSELDCVKFNRSILGIVSRPSVEIYLSKPAADESRVGFSTAFMMIAELI